MQASETLACQFPDAPNNAGFSDLKRKHNFLQAMPLGWQSKFMEANLRFENELLNNMHIYFDWLQALYPYQKSNKTPGNEDNRQNNQGNQNCNQNCSGKNGNNKKITSEIGNQGDNSNNSNWDNCNNNSQQIQPTDLCPLLLHGNHTWGKCWSNWYNNATQGNQNNVNQNKQGNQNSNQNYKSNTNKANNSNTHAAANEWNTEKNKATNKETNTSLERSHLKIFPRPSSLTTRLQQCVGFEKGLSEWNSFGKANPDGAILSCGRRSSSWTTTRRKSRHGGPQARQGRRSDDWLSSVCSVRRTFGKLGRPCIWLSIQVWFCVGCRRSH